MPSFTRSLTSKIKTKLNSSPASPTPSSTHSRQSTADSGIAVSPTKPKPNSNMTRPGDGFSANRGQTSLGVISSTPDRSSTGDKRRSMDNQQTHMYSPATYHSPSTAPSSPESLFDSSSPRNFVGRKLSYESEVSSIYPEDDGGAKERMRMQDLREVEWFDERIMGLKKYSADDYIRDLGVN
ncbi:hypothetical protein YB2330_003340 [Saitoella coloradoensis]